MLGWMDDEALHRTLTTGRATYWSRSRQEYWVKGETSGHVQWVKEVRLDCDGDTLLVKVDQEGAACHTGDRTCFDADVLLARRWPMPEPPPDVRPGRPARARVRPRWPRWPAAEPGSRPLGRRGAAGLVVGDPAAATRRDAAGTALGLVVLACWGVLLVTRGRVRRVVAVLGAARRRRALVAVVVPAARRCPTSSATSSSRVSPATGRPELHGLVLGWPPSGPCSPWSPASLAVALVPALAGDGQPVRRARRRGGTVDAPPEEQIQPRPVEGDRRGSRPDRRDLLTRLCPRTARRPRPEEPACLTTTATPPQPGPPSPSPCSASSSAASALMLARSACRCSGSACALGVASLVVFAVMAKMGLTSPATDARSTSRRPSREPSSTTRVRRLCRPS